MKKSAPIEAERTRYVIWWYRIYMTSCFLIGVPVFATLVDYSDVLGIVIGWSLTSVPFFITLRASRLGVIDLYDGEVVIYGLLRTRRIPWSEISAVDVGRGSNIVLLPWRVPSFELLDGSQILADEFRSFRKNSLVDAVVEESRKRISPHQKSVPADAEQVVSGDG